MNNSIKEKYIKLKPYILVFFAFLSSLLIISFLLDTFLLPALVHSKDNVKMPPLVGKNVTEAQSDLTSTGLKLFKTIDQYSETVPKGIVISQSPKQDQTVREGRSVYLTVSLGEETVAMPYLVGKTLRDARVAVMNIGLTVGDIVYDFSQIYGPDTIIAQSIGPNQQIVYGKTVNLTVSKGAEEQVLVPNILYSSFNDGFRLIKESGLILGRVDSVSNETYIQHTIIRQEPEAGTTVNKNTVINLIISK